MPTRAEMEAAMSGGPSREEMIANMSSKESKWPIKQDQYKKPFAPNVQMIAEDLIKSPSDKAMAKGPEAVSRLKAARAMPAYEKFARSAGNQLLDFGYGASDVADTLVGMSSIGDIESVIKSGNKGMVKSLLGEGDSISRQAQRRIDHAQEVSGREEYESEEGIPGLLGKFAVGMLGERYAGPVFRAGAGKVFDTVDDVAKKVVGGTQNNLHRVVGQDRADVFNKWKKGYSKQAPKNATSNTGVAADIAGGTALAATEGALDYDSNALGAGAGGLAASLVAHGPLKRLTKRVSQRTPLQNQTLKEAHAAGYRVTPATKTGDLSLINKERKWRNDFDAGGAQEFGRIDSANKAIDNQLAAKAMGFEVPAKHLEPGKLQEMLAASGKKYDDLVEGTQGRFDNKQWTAFVDDADKVAKQGNIDVKGDVEQVMNNLNRETNRYGRDALTGKMKPWTFDGKTFQAERKRLNDKIGKYIQAGDQESASALRPVLKHLDEAIDRGMAYGGKVSAKEWRNANEEYAMRNILMQSGFDMHGNVRSNKLYEFFNDDIERILRAKGGKVKNLHTIAKFEELQNPIFRSSMDQGVLENSAKRQDKSMLGTLIKGSSGGGGMSPFRQSMSNLYMTGYPVETGLLNMNKTGLWSPAAINRSVNMATGAYPEALRLGAEGIDWGKEKAKSIEEIIDNM